MTVSAATLRKLAALSLSPEQMAGVLDLLADQVQADEDRRSGQRERTRKSRLGITEKQECNVTVTDTVTDNECYAPVTDTDGSLSPVPPSFPPHPPNNPLTPKPSTKTKSARGHRLPADTVMTGPDLAYALAKGLTERQAASLFERFCSWAWSASGPNAVKVNWHQAWQGWVQREAPAATARAGPSSSAKPATAYQQRRNETKEINDELDSFASGSSSGSPAYSGLLRYDSGQRPEGLRRGLSGDVIDLPAVCRG